MTLVSLPLENLEHIFHFLDGKSFSKAREVCKTWNGIIKEMQMKHEIWKQFCLLEIPDYIMKEILCFKTVPLNDSFLNWSTLYKRWFKSRMVVKAPYTLKSISTFNKSQAAITCLRFSGSWVITSHSSGHLCIWNQYTGELWQKYLCHLKSIVDMALINLLNLDYYYGLEDLPWNHHHIITISKDSYIQVISLLEKLSFSNLTHLKSDFNSADLISIRVFDTLFAVSASDNSVSLWSMNVTRKPCFQLSITLLHRIIGPLDILLNIGLWHGQIHCISYSGKLHVYNTEDEIWTELRCLKNIYNGCTYNKLVTITNSFLFRDKIAIFFTSDCRMVISINEKVYAQYHMMIGLQTVIVSVALKGTLLALGGENGKLYVFYVPETKDLLRLNFSCPSYTVRLSEASITSLDIFYGEKTPVIIGGTNESLFIVKWYAAISCHQQVHERKYIQKH